MGKKLVACPPVSGKGDATGLIPLQKDKVSREFQLANIGEFQSLTEVGKDRFPSLYLEWRQKVDGKQVQTCRIQTRLDLKKTEKCFPQPAHHPLIQMKIKLDLITRAHQTPFRRIHLFIEPGSFLHSRLGSRQVKPRVYSYQAIAKGKGFQYQVSRESHCWIQVD